MAGVPTPALRAISAKDAAPYPASRKTARPASKSASLSRRSRGRPCRRPGSLTCLIIIRHDLKLNVLLRYSFLYNAAVGGAEVVEGGLRVVPVEAHPLLATALASIVEGQT